jgi:hypothetical protein
MTAPFPPNFRQLPEPERNRLFLENLKESRAKHASVDVSALNANSGQHWPLPKPLPKGLLPVAGFDADFLPASIAPWVMDISDRMQCPPDFVGIAAVVAMGSVLGRKVGIRPQIRTDWLEVPNLWGCIVGRPGAMKSPAMAEALKPLHKLEVEASKANLDAARDYALAVEIHKISKDEATKKARKIIGEGKSGVEALLELTEPEKPLERRYVVNDATYEKLGEILADNPNGVLAFRDEIVSLLKTLDREDNAAARGFFLTAWNGTAGYKFDRIMRGKTNIEAVCVSLLGSTQPGRLAEYVRRASGAGDDGLIQRFGLLIWPDQSPEWRNVDRFPDSEAKAAAWEVFDRLDKLDPEAVSACHDQFGDLPYLRFDEAAQEVFTGWRTDLEARLRAADLAPSLESHLAKYRKLVPTLALINHLADGGSGSVSETALVRALAFSDYLETHARRAYGSGTEAESETAKAILSRIRKGDLRDDFTARDVYRNQWSGLSDREAVQAGLELLVDLDWLAASSSQTGGRSRTSYRINPRGEK